MPMQSVRNAPGDRRPRRRLAALAAWLLALPASAAAGDDRHVVLVTLDGVRIQELFGGMDPSIAVGEADADLYDLVETRARYWRESPRERREALLPFLWKTLAPAGMVIGNPALGSGVTVRNTQWFSYPGYSEILTGAARPEVQSNDYVRYPHETVLDHAQRMLGLPASAVAQFGSWDGFKYAASRADGGFVMNGAYDALPAALSTPEMDRLVALRREVMGLWEESSSDALTFRLALAYLERHRPRVLWLGLGQSDDWSHARRYDRLLDYLHLADGWLAELWSRLQSLEHYRDRTTLIVTTDHGRGRTGADWIEHGEGIEGSQDIWIAILGPDTPALGEVAGLAGVAQGDVAATLLRHLGLDPAGFNADAGPPIPGSLKTR